MVNLEVSRVFRAGGIGDTAFASAIHPSLRHLMGEEKNRFERVCKLLMDSKPKPLLPKQSAKFKCPKLLRNLVRKCLDMSACD